MDLGQGADPQQAMEAQALQQQQAHEQQALHDAQQAAQQAAQQQVPQPPPAGVPISVRNPHAHIGKVNIRTFQGKEQEGVILWVRYSQQVARLSGWSDNEAVALAELHMLDKAQSWFVGLDRATLTSFDALAKLMIDRFGDSITTLMTRLDHRKQESTESVWMPCACCLQRLATLQKGKPLISLVG